MDKQIIISIGRAFGSGGHAIGEKLAQHYGIKLYDKNIVNLLAEQTNLDPEQLGKLEEKVTGKFFPWLKKNGFAASQDDLMTKSRLTQSDRIFLLESALIHELAQKESFVIVGRAANAILEGYPNTLRLYVYAQEDFKIARVKEVYHLESDQEAKKLMNDTDKARREYFEYYSSMTWGSSDGHDASIDSSAFGLDGTVELIKEMVRLKLGIG